MNNIEELKIFYKVQICTLKSIEPISIMMRDRVEVQIKCIEGFLKKKISQINKSDEWHKQLVKIDKKIFYWELWAAGKNEELIACLRDLRDLCPKFSQQPKTKEGEGCR